MNEKLISTDRYLMGILDLDRKNIINTAAIDEIYIPSALDRAAYLYNTDISHIVVIGTIKGDILYESSTLDYGYDSYVDKLPNDANIKKIRIPDAKTQVITRTYIIGDRGELYYSHKYIAATSYDNGINNYALIEAKDQKAAIAEYNDYYKNLARARTVIIGELEKIDGYDGYNLKVYDNRANITEMEYISGCVIVTIELNINFECLDIKQFFDNNSDRWLHGQDISTIPLP